MLVRPRPPAISELVGHCPLILLLASENAKVPEAATVDPMPASGLAVTPLGAASTIRSDCPRFQMRHPCSRRSYADEKERTQDHGTQVNLGAIRLCLGHRIAVLHQSNRSLGLWQVRLCERTTGAAATDRDRRHTVEMMRDTLENWQIAASRSREARSTPRYLAPRQYLPIAID